MFEVIDQEMIMTMITLKEEKILTSGKKIEWIMVPSIESRKETILTP